jgi:hypothetical protein
MSSEPSSVTLVIVLEPLSVQFAPASTTSAEKFV